jgi:cell pole-organizing protein PopZ
MSENSSEQEPSIEEILASIRQIISDDDEEEVQEEPEEAVEEVLESPVHETSTNDVLELTEEDLVEIEEPEEAEVEEEIEEVIEPEPVEMEVELRDRLEEIRAAADAEPELEIEEEPEMPPKNTVPSDILSSGTQAAALDSITKLASKMPINSPRSYDGVTLEDIVREMLHPMLREWMDDHLPSMVERIVQKELEKLARRALDD